MRHSNKTSSKETGISTFSLFAYFLRLEEEEEEVEEKAEDVLLLFQAASSQQQCVRRSMNPIMVEMDPNNFYVALVSTQSNVTAFSINCTQESTIHQSESV